MIFIGFNVPSIFWRLCIDVVSPLLCHNVECILLLVIVHNVPEKKPREDQSYVKRKSPRVLFHHNDWSRVLLCCADIDGSFQLLLTVVLKVHEL